jgi:hypothetical protein
MRAFKRWVAAVAGLCPISVLAAPPPPSLLAPYIRDGRFEPGDYGWMRGRFADASPADKAATVEIGKWVTACHQAGEAETRAKLAGMGIADAKLERGPISDPLCGAVAHTPFQLQAKTFPEFQRALAEAAPVADTYLLAVRQAERIGGPRGPGLADALLARPFGEQMLRLGVGWGDGEMKDAPVLSADAKAILVARLGAAMGQRDHENTQWMKALVAKEGWPKISAVGERASQQAWLLVQHADADPVFQLQALRLMEPLVASGEVKKQNYAYLYDRIMLKLAGKQRYATQVTCSGGKRMPQPLEDETAVERLRSEVGLNPLTEYMADVNKMFGECRPDPVPAPASKGQSRS